MQLRFSVLARSRAFSKAMRRVRIKIQPLLDAFETMALAHPVYEAILVGITDDKEPGFVQEVENEDGFFQILAGCSHRATDDELTAEVFNVLREAVRLCPLATTDHENLDAMFARLRNDVLDP